MIEKGKKALGALGEEYGCQYLESIGHRILERNWQGGHLEIDIVSEAADGVHFVEVKSRTAPLEAAPEENVTRPKQMKITRAAARYLRERHREGNVEVFFDILTVVFDGGKTDIRYFPQAWIPLYI